MASLLVASAQGAVDDKTTIAIYTGNVSGHGRCYAVLATSIE
jgi:hypothetical protein